MGWLVGCVMRWCAVFDGHGEEDVGCELIGADVVFEKFRRDWNFFSFGGNGDRIAEGELSEVVGDLIGGSAVEVAENDDD